jgi:hypothetical protein
MGGFQSVCFSCCGSLAWWPLGRSTGWSARCWGASGLQRFGSSIGGTLGDCRGVLERPANGCSGAGGRAGLNLPHALSLLSSRWPKLPTFTLEPTIKKPLSSAHRRPGQRVESGLGSYHEFVGGWQCSRAARSWWYLRESLNAQLPFMQAITSTMYVYSWINCAGWVCRCYE